MVARYSRGPLLRLLLTTLIEVVEPTEGIDALSWSITLPGIMAGDRSHWVQEAVLASGERLEQMHVDE